MNRSSPVGFARRDTDSAYPAAADLSPFRRPTRVVMAAYLVTGGAGFIGSHLVEKLVRRGERVRVVDSLITGKRSNLAQVESAIEFMEGDLALPDVARQAVLGMDYVLHQAAIPSVPDRTLRPGLPATGPTWTARSTLWWPPETRESNGWYLPAHRRSTGMRPPCRSTRTWRRAHCHPMPCRSWQASNTPSCSPRCMGSRR